MNTSREQLGPELEGDFGSIDDDVVEVGGIPVRLKFFGVLAICLPLLAACAIFVLFFGPKGQLVLTYYENGYPLTRARMLLQESGEPEYHGEFLEWHPSGELMRRGNMEHGLPVGEWEYFTPDGSRDPERSGHYELGARVRGLEL